MQTESIHILESLVQQEKIAELTEMLTEMPSAEVVEFLDEKEIPDIIRFFDLLNYETVGRLFSEFDQELQIELYNSYSRPKFARIFPHISSDVRADFYQTLSLNEQIDFIPYLDKRVREDVIALSSYPPDTAGGIMTTDFATILLDMTAEEAITKLRSDAPSKKMVYYLYVVNENMKMQGILTLKNLILSDPKEEIKNLYNEFFVFAGVYEDQKDVAAKVERYDLVAIPILNDYQQLVGIVHHDDALDVIRAEQTEDMERFMGILPTDNGQDYLDSSSIYHFKKRVPWIVSLAAIGLISGVIIHKYQSFIEGLMVLALYMPMMAATGGNSGSQAATMIIRAMSLGEVTDKDWLKIIFKEAQVSLMLSICVGALVFLKIAFLTSQGSIPSHMNASYIALIISSAIALQVISSAIIGAGLPILVKKLGGDPAVAASPAIATVVDITGLLIYFGIVSLTITF
jgi:magnesium transporter